MQGRLALVLVGCFAVCPLQLGWGQSSFSPKFDANAHDFGRVAHGTKQVHEFKFTNTTENPVVVSNVSVSCNCTSAQIDRNTIQPGQEGVVTATMDTGRFYGDKSVTVYVDFAQPVVMRSFLRVAAYSSNQVLEGSGYTVNLGAVQEGKGKTKSMHLDYGNPNWKVSLQGKQSDDMKVSLDEERRDDKGVRYRLSVTLPEGTPLGHFQRKVRLKTNDTKYTDIVVAVKADVVPGVIISPAALSVADIAPGESVTRRVLVRSNKPFKVTGVTPETTGVSYKTVGDEPKTAQMVMITITMPKEPGKLPEHIDLKTNLPGDTTARLSLNR